MGALAMKGIPLALLALVPRLLTSPPAAGTPSEPMKVPRWSPPVLGGEWARTEKVVMLMLAIMIVLAQRSKQERMVLLSSSRTRAMNVMVLGRGRR